MLSEKEKGIWSQTKLPYLPESIQSTKAKAVSNVWRLFLFCIKEHNHVGEWEEKKCKKTLKTTLVRWVQDACGKKSCHQLWRRYNLQIYLYLYLYLHIHTYMAATIYREMCWENMLVQFTLQYSRCRLPHDQEICYHPPLPNMLGSLSLCQHRNDSLEAKVRNATTSPLSLPEQGTAEAKLYS